MTPFTLATLRFTGSTSGSAGVHGNCWLRDGDRIRAEIDQIGILDVSVHDDRSAT